MKEYNSDIEQMMNQYKDKLLNVKITTPKSDSSNNKNSSKGVVVKVAGAEI